MYAEDLKGMEGDLGKVVTVWAVVKEKEVEETRKLWERTFDQPYEKGGGEIALKLDGGVSFKPLVYWEASDTDVNTKYKPMHPRFLLEVSLTLSLPPVALLNIRKEIITTNMKIKRVLLETAKYQELYFFC